MRKSTYNRLYRTYVKMAEMDDLVNDGVEVVDGVARFVPSLIKRGERNGIYRFGEVGSSGETTETDNGSD